MTPLEKLKQLRADRARAEAEQAKAQGALDSAMEQLKTFGVESLESAEVRLGELDTQIAEADQEIARLTAELDRLVGGGSNAGT